MDKKYLATQIRSTDFKNYYYAQDFILLKDIREGILITEDDRYINTLEVIPSDILLKPNDEKSAIVDSYISWLNISPARTHLKILTRKTDTRIFQENVDRALVEEENPMVQQLGKQYKDEIKALGYSSSISQRFFLSYEYEPENEFQRDDDFDHIHTELLKTENMIRHYFSDCGNICVTPENPNISIAKYLYDYYNTPKDNDNFENRILRLSGDIRKLTNTPENEDTPFLALKDIVSPKGVDFSHKGFSIVDGVYKTHLYIDGEGLPEYMHIGWISNLFSIDGDFDIDIFTERASEEKILSKSSNKIKFTGIKLNTKSSHEKDYEETEEVLSSAEYIKRAIAYNQQIFYYAIFITLSANTLDELLYKKERIITKMKAKQLPLISCEYNEAEAFLNISPFLTPSKRLFNRAKRNLTTKALACCYPYTSFQMCDPGGILLGLNLNNYSLCMINIFDTSKYVNGNICIFGTSGAGKTYTLLLIALRMRIMGCQVFILSPEKQHEFKRSCLAIGGTFIDLSPSSNDCINIMEIRPIVSPSTEYLDYTDFDDTVWLSSKVQQLKTWLGLLITKPSMSDEEAALVTDAIMNVYKKKGITNDNNSLYIDPKDKDAGLKEMPILEDLYNEPTLPQRIRNILKPFIKGDAQSFNGQTNVDLNNNFIVFGLEHLHKSENLVAPGMFAALDIVWTRTKADRIKKKVIVIDEGWKLLNGEHPAAARYVQNIFKVIRGYGGAAIFSTQEIMDLYKYDNGSFGNAILACSKTKIILKLEKTEIPLIKNTLELTDLETKSILKFTRGKAIICANSSHVPIEFIASPEEHKLITTDRNDLEKMYKEKRNDV